MASRAFETILLKTWRISVGFGLDFMKDAFLQEIRGTAYQITTLGSFSRNKSNLPV
jgi:hypothetical protein